MTKKFNPLVLKLFVLTFLLIISSIPRSYVDSIIDERQSYQRQAIDSVVTGWAARHAFGRVVLALPYSYKTEVIDEKGKKTESSFDETTLVNPTLEKIVVTDKIEKLKRGIFDIPIYKADLTMEGEFAVPTDLSSRLKNETWNEADQTLTFETKQTAAISEFSFELDGKSRKLRRAAEGLVLSFKEAGLKPGQKFRFKLQAKLNGYDGLDIAAVADEFEVSLVSAWPHPSFHGQLPMEKEIGKDGFSAKWKIVQPSIDQKITVDYIEPVNVYSQGARALKYGFLITLLCLSVLFLMETLGRISIHGMQYLLMTLPLTCFYVLLIALAEHIGFSISYAVATAAVIGLIFIYFRGIGASRKQSFGLSGILTGVYSLVLTMLSSEDYALLIGAISLFLCLAAFMIMTRKLDWSKNLGPKQTDTAHA